MQQGKASARIHLDTLYKVVGGVGDTLSYILWGNPFIVVEGTGNA